MATWEDGPEYAPLERPDAFAEPSAATVGLVAPPPPPTVPPAPADRPAFADPAQAVPPLAALVPAPPARRDPELPFHVASSAMTAESSAWASAHWAPPTTPAPQAPITTTPGPRQGGVFDQPSRSAVDPYGTSPYGTSPAETSPNGGSPNGQQHSGAPNYPPPTGAPAYPPHPANPANQPFPPPAYPSAGGPFPAPGTPQWFGPGGYPPPPPQPTSPTAKSVLSAATPGLLVTLTVGAIIWVLAPVTVVVAFLLTSRMTYGRKATRTAFGVVLAVLGLVGLLAYLAADDLFAAWWDTVAAWACFGSWVLVVTTLIAVYRAIKQGRSDPPTTPRASLR